MPESVEGTLAAGEDFLEHFGIKGMKWGVTRTETQIGRNTVATSNGRIKDVKLATATKNRTTASKDAAVAAISKKKASEKSIDSLSNTELKNLVTRMNLEKQYKDLKRTDMTATQKFVNDILEKDVKKGAQTLASAEIAKVFAKAMKK